MKSLEITREGIAFHIENTVNIARQPALREDLSGQSLRYAKGYEPHAISPNTQNETYVLAALPNTGFLDPRTTSTPRPRGTDPPNNQNGMFQLPNHLTE